MSSKKIIGRSETKDANAFLSSVDDTESCAPVFPPHRIHSVAYHRAPLLSNHDATESLLTWFDSISEKRKMPWRKPWLDPAAFDRNQEELERSRSERAYQVWVSEIMLQQTRVSVVIPYFNNWISKWPTVEDLSHASQDEVLAAWKGLGYYSRATRLLEAAQQIVNDMDGRIPGDVESLRKIKGIGRYTAGAVSSIAFGHAAPVLDGNVSRVLCRQLGLYARVKEKSKEDLLWKAAAMLVENVTSCSIESGLSDIPGRWNQGLMELGSTICTPKPKCHECPIQSTCRAYAEGQLLGRTSSDVGMLEDIEDACYLCEQLELEEVEAAVAKADTESDSSHLSKPRRKRTATVTELASRTAKSAKANTTTQRSIHDFTTLPGLATQSASPPTHPQSEQDAKVIAYCSLFPKREPKKKTPEEECAVCIIRRDTDLGDHYLIEQRPPNGLLASLWQFPTYKLPTNRNWSLKLRKTESRIFVQRIVGHDRNVKLSPTTERGSVTHVFSHLRLQMYVHEYRLGCDDSIAREIVSEDGPKRLWVSRQRVSDATLSTGMRRCWEQYRSSGN
ncbi:A/G-specific adenine glycosylase [Verruconis gallopava]|uniref:Adenine DNA glycosylase n=1 Tax=Verruconis gallopava TaxID=253628 RepID=A0A0D2AAM4_9PEZI|nr:A/G-specific adenine glycosylase [Verruconis gallopava]KIW03630.1 A/G-specific adenine glycosylase [Verruconis gallopava]